MNRIIFFLLISTGGVLPGHAQTDAVQNLYFSPKGVAVHFGENDYQPGKHAFYIYRNCIYQFGMADRSIRTALVVDVRHDSIYYIAAFSAHSLSTTAPYDTLALHPAQIRSIYLIADRILALYKNQSLKRHQFHFENSLQPKSFRVEKQVRYSEDSSYSTEYELVYYMTAQGLNSVYEHRGTSYYYEGILPDPKRDAARTLPPFQHRKWVWVSPTHANKVSGLNLGIQTMTASSRDSLVIDGVNINADVLSMFVTVFGIAHIIAGPKRLRNGGDSVEKRPINARITGLSISGGGLMGEMLVRGVSINGGMSLTTVVCGLQISGLFSQSYLFKGLMVSGLSNVCTKGRGLQVALFNRCRDLKGVQVGLWNVNGKRKLPIINWDF